ncbi:HIT family protein [Alphaproteobacteria bacterium]|nr:HIT family protein [Alphaproteobacteria bacterium]MDC0147996.1 HIT family protein [Alphaproteobacteria bacterium]
MSGFSLDPRLAADTLPIGVIDNIDIRLMRDRRYWWLVLVPQIAGAQEWQDLPALERHSLLDVSMRGAEALRELAKADKMNVAALGNMVRQLHVHVVARHEGDAAWPAPVWGVGERLDYEVENAGQRIKAIQGFFNL